MTTAATPPAPAGASAREWDIFCRVVDNFGDIGTCWRLARALARRGQRVRLHTDDASALQWMAPAGEPGVRVVAWSEAPPAEPPGEVVVEAFGCDPPAAFVAAMAARARAGRAPVWLNLEYLSAESYVERSHGLASPQAAGPGRGLVKWFFYPGYTAATGGLLREPEPAPPAPGERAAWLAAHGLRPEPGERLVSLFCYAQAPVERLVAALGEGARGALVATAPGAATDRLRACLAAGAPGRVRQVALPWLGLDDYDRLLRSADLNVVRGEDSWVRAQAAARPFLWQAYIQADGAHGPKVEAFLERLLEGVAAPEAAFWRGWHRAWNGLEPTAVPPLPAWDEERLAGVGAAARAWREKLDRQPDLVSNLLAFVGQKG